MDIESWFLRNSNALAAVHTAEGVRDQFLKAAAEAGFDAIACGEIDLEDRRRSSFFINTWPKAWFDYYTREKVHEFDPIMARILKRPGAFTWSDITARTPRERELFVAIKQFGWADGLAVAIPRNQKMISLVSLTSPTPIPDGDWRQLAVLYFTMAYEKYRLLNSGSGTVLNLAGLTPRENESVALVAKGLTDADIARELGISPATAHEHVERAKKKLGCRNRAQLVAVAVTLGLATP